MTTPTKTVSTSSLMQEGRSFPPSQEVIQRAYINHGQYQKMYDRSIKDPDGFWLEQAATLDWIKKPTKGRKYVWDTAAKRVEHTWFEDGQLNVTVNCLDRHLKTKTRDKVAILWQGEPENDVVKLTYAQLHEKVCKFANVLKSFGIKKGDRVSIYLPMIPELPIVMLACARIGAIHSVVFGGFSSEALAGPHQRRRLQAAHHLQHLAPRRQKHSAQDHGRRGAQGNLHHREGHRRQAQRNPVRHDAEPRRLVPRFDGKGFRGLSAGDHERRRPAVHPLHVRLDGQTEGRRPLHRRLSAANRAHAQIYFRRA